MGEKELQYKALLSGINSAEFHIKKLQSNPLFETDVSHTEQAFNAEVFGPKKEHPRDKLNDIKIQLSQRAKNIGLFVPKTVDSTAKDIHFAGMAERIVLIGRMHLCIPVCEKNAKAEVLIQVREEGGERVRKCLDYYVCWRISCLAQALEMVVDGNVEKL